MSAKEFAIDALTRHQVYLNRYGTGQVKEMIPYVNKMLRDVNIELSVGNLTDFGRKRLSVLQNDLTQIINLSMSDMGKNLTSNLIDLGEYEAEFAQKMLGDLVSLDTGGVTLQQISAAITDNKMLLASGKNVSRMTIDQAITQLAKSTSRGVRHSLTTGIAQGKTTKEIAKEISRQLKGRTTAQAEAVVRTAANHAGTQARNALYAENADVLDGEEFVATLDSRTSLPCAGNDGKIFPVGQGVFPPIHYNCRSIRVPIVNPDFVVGDTAGDRPSRGASGAQKVSAQSNFSGWLRKQPKGFQDEYFKQFPDGAARSKLFRNGGLPIDKFVDNKNIVYSLDELKKLEPKAFERAGLIKKAEIPKPAPKPKPIKKKETSTIGAGQKVTYQKRKEVEALLKTELADAASDSRYVLARDGLPAVVYKAQNRVRGKTNTELARAIFGKPKITGLSDDAASLIYSTMRETNDIAKIYNVPPLRSVKTGAGRGAAASMGDGVLTVKTDYFNKYGTRYNKGATEKKLSDIVVKYEAVEVEIKDLRRQIDEIKDQGLGYSHYHELARKMNKKIDSYNRYRKKYSEALPAADFKVSKWKVGDPDVDRPDTAKYYYDNPEDFLRSTVYHEMGHHIHQNFGVTDLAGLRAPPVEQLLRKLFRGKRTVSPTKYSSQDPFEWFAENFSLYHMGKTKLVDPILKEMLEHMAAGTYGEFARGII